MSNPATESQINYINTLLTKVKKRVATIYYPSYVSEYWQRVEIPVALTKSQAAGLIDDMKSISYYKLNPVESFFLYDDVEWPLFEAANNWLLTDGLDAVRAYCTKMPDGADNDTWYDASVRMHDFVRGQE